MDLVYFGSGAFGLPTLRHLAVRHRLRAVVTQPDRPAGRGGALTPTPVGAHALAAFPDAPLLRPENVNDPSIVQHLRSIKADAWIVIAFGQKLSAMLLDGVFAINLHASLLPRWRGAAPINAAILAGDAETGNSVITLADRMDAGLILGQSKRRIDLRCTAGDLHDLLAGDGTAVMDMVLDQHAAGSLRPSAQDPTRVTRAPKLSKADGWIRFSDGAESCRRRVHGLNPWPGVTATLAGQTLKLLRVQPEPARAEQAEVGTILDPAAGFVACRASTLRLLEVQPAGKRAMPWSDFARGHRVRAGDRFETGAEA